MILAIDPGTTKSGVVILDGPHVISPGVVDNSELAASLARGFTSIGIKEIVIEMIACYGMAVGRETFETVIWIGRFMQAADVPVHRLARLDVKMHLCHNPRAKDTNVWQAILDRYGGESAVGKKASPGPLYGVKSHARAALALGLAFQDGVRSKHFAKETAA